MSNTAITDHALAVRLTPRSARRSLGVHGVAELPHSRGGRWERPCEEIWDTAVRGAWSEGARPSLSALGRPPWMPPT